MIMYPNIVLFFGWIITLPHKVHTSNVIYEVFENQTNWLQAANTCWSLNGTLVDASDYCDVQNKTDLPISRSYWTGNFTFMTNWVQLKGCFQQPRKNIVRKCTRFEKSNRPLGWSCYIYCNKESFFGIADGYCKCLSSVPMKFTQQNKCPSCNDSSRFQCGEDSYIAVYEIASTQTPTINNNNTNNKCASYECYSNMSEIQYIAQSCDAWFPFTCTGGDMTSNSDWNDARDECEKEDTYMLQPPDFICDRQVSPAWGNRHREIIQTTTELDFPYGFETHQDRLILQCSSISGTGMQYENCSSVKHGFICKIGKYTNENATTLCNISETEPETSTQSPAHTTPGETTSSVFSAIDPTTNISTMSTIEGNTMATSNTVTYIVIGAAAGGFLAIVLVIIVIICTCRYRSRKSNADETEGDYKEINVDDGEINHINAAERYIKIKSEQASVKYTVENGKAATKTSDPGKTWGEGYDQIVLPNEKPDCGLLDQGGADHVKKPSSDINETSNVIQNTEEEDDYAEVDSESITEGNIPDIHVQSASIKKAEINDQQETEDDYDHFTQTDQRQSVSSNYDHVHLRNSQKSQKRSNQDDSEDYDHIPGAGGRREKAEVDSTYDHTQVFGLRGSTASMSSNYDHVVLLQNDRISDDYDHTTNVSKVEVADGDRDSNYTSVILPDSP